MMSLSLIAVPVFLDTTTQGSQLVQQWNHMYKYGFPILPTISVATFSLYVYTAIREYAAKGAWLVYAIAGVTTVTMIPFTWVFLWPTNNRLMELEKGSRAGLLTSLEETRALVQLWSRTHLVRSF